MGDLQTAEQVYELLNRMIYYLEIVNGAITEGEYKVSQFKGKRETLLQYIRSAKEIAKNLSINSYANEHPRGS